MSDSPGDSPSAFGIDRGGRALVRAVVLDLDGTLVDTMQTFADVASDVMASAFGISRAWGRARYLQTSGIPFFQQLEIIMPGNSANQRVAQRFERFKEVVLDFDGVPEIGQAFADELFRVFAGGHPDVRLKPINTSEAVAQMVRRTMSASGPAK